MGKEIVAVAIPIYKELPGPNERISLAQCMRVLSHYPIVFFAPNSLDTGFYENYCSGKDVKIERFDDDFFTGIDGYNRLMLSPYFYKRFFNFKFILVYQLDAYVFKDDLLYWCDQDYDFIGAPHAPRKNREGEMHFLKNYARLLAFMGKYLRVKHQISNVGNGGFSLRKVRSCHWLLKILKSKVDRAGSANEDGFFEYWGNLFYPLFKLPDDETALRFSIESSPRES